MPTVVLRIEKKFDRQISKLVTSLNVATLPTLLLSYKLFGEVKLFPVIFILKMRQLIFWEFN